MSNRSLTHDPTREVKSDKPADVIDDIYIVDVAILQCEISRWRRLKFSLTKISLHESLKDFLIEAFEFYQFRQGFEEILTEILQEKLPEEEARDLARRCARSEPAADKKVEAFLQIRRQQIDNIVHDAKVAKATTHARFCAAQSCRTRAGY